MLVEVVSKIKSTCERELFDEAKRHVITKIDFAMTVE